MKNPLISVLIPTYNRAQYIREAIDSVLAQDYDNLEIVVVDDGSTDNTREIVERYVETLHATSLHKPVKYFYKENGGISSARNACLVKASGEYIAWLDADDYWAEGKLQAQMKYFEEHPDCQVIFTAFQNFVESNVWSEERNIPEEFVYEKTCKHCFPSALIKKELFNNYGLFLENLVVGEDTEMVYRWVMFGVNIKHYLKTAYYRRRLHGENVTLTCNDTTVEAMRDIIKAVLVKYSAKSGVPIGVIEKIQRDQNRDFVLPKLRNNVHNKRTN